MKHTKKTNILLLSAALLNLNTVGLHATNSGTEAPSNLLKSKNTASLKTGDILSLSEFEKTNHHILYKITKKGTGKKPVQGETVLVHYTGYLLVDGKKVGFKFDSSLDRNAPFSFKLGARPPQVITGWEISLADMKIGEERIVILPSKHAYGSRATGTIPADSTLIFEIKLIKAS